MEKMLTRHRVLLEDTRTALMKTRIKLVKHTKNLKNSVIGDAVDALDKVIKDITYDLRR